MLRLKHDRPPARSHRHSRKQTGPAHTDQVTIRLRDKAPEPRRIEGKLQGIPCRLPPQRIIPELDRRRLRSLRPSLLKQLPISRRRHHRRPPALPHRRQKVEQIPLPAPHFAKLLEKQDLHRRTAIASTHRYKGSTRQNVSRSADIICAASAIQKQKIQVP